MKSIENFVAQYRQSGTLGENLIAARPTFQEEVQAFEMVLANGLLAQLEEAGIVPKGECPNPYPNEAILERDEDWCKWYDKNMETAEAYLRQMEKQHNQWWDEHPGEREEYEEKMERRKEVLHHIFLGWVIR